MLKNDHTGAATVQAAAPASNFAETAPSDVITILRSRRARLAKLVRSNGSIESYDKARTFDGCEVPVSSLDTLGRLLKRLQWRPDCAIVRGALIAGGPVRGIRRLVYPDAQNGDGPTLREASHQWLALDMDEVDRPGSVPAEDLGRCASFAIRQLPPPFHDARCIIQATGGHGLKPGSRLRLWYWLDRPVGCNELKYWMRSTSSDQSIFNAAQLIYSAAPVFVRGAPDHIPRRIVERPGIDMVGVPSLEELRPPRVRVSTVSAALPASSARGYLYVRTAIERTRHRIITATQRHPVILSEACGLARLVMRGLLQPLDFRAVIWEAAQQVGKCDEGEIERILHYAMQRADAAAVSTDLVAQTAS